MSEVNAGACTLWGLPTPVVGDRVRHRKTGEEAIVVRLGTFAGVYMVEPELDGRSWHATETIERANPVCCPLIDPNDV